MRKRKVMAAGAGAAKSAAVAVVSDHRNFPTEKEIAALAYSFWEARGPADGSPEGDWLRAENELRTQRRRRGLRAPSSSAEPDERTAP